MSGLKPILEELKNLKSNINKENIQSFIVSNVQENKEKLEQSLSNLAESTRNNPVIQEYVDQVLKAELTNQAMEKLQTKFPDHEVVKKIASLRSFFINMNNERDMEDVKTRNLQAEQDQSQQAAAKDLEETEVVDVIVQETITVEKDSEEANTSEGKKA